MNDFNGEFLSRRKWLGIGQAASGLFLRNPFEGAAVLYRNGRKAEVMNNRLRRFRTARNEKITVVADA